MISYSPNHQRFTSSFSTKSQLRPLVIFRAFSVILFDLGWYRLICQRSQPEGVPPISSRVVEGLRVVGDSLIPDKYCAGLIPHTALQILALRNVVEEEVENAIRLLLVKSDCRTQRVSTPLFIGRSYGNLPIRFVYTGFTYNAFSLVTGCTITTGCSFTSSARRITASVFFFSCVTPSLFEWIAVNPSSLFLNRGESALYAATLELTSVSPPAAAGDSSIPMNVVPGG